jgi:hypothetical protein
VPDEEDIKPVAIDRRNLNIVSAKPCANKQTQIGVDADPRNNAGEDTNKHDDAPSTLFTCFPPQPYHERPPT